MLGYVEHSRDRSSDDRKFAARWYFDSPVANDKADDGRATESAQDGESDVGLGVGAIEAVVTTCDSSSSLVGVNLEGCQECEYVTCVDCFT